MDDFDSNLRLARDVKAKNIKIGMSVLMDEGFIRVSEISRNFEDKKKLAFYDKDGVLILAAFPDSEILAGS